MHNAAVIVIGVIVAAFIGGITNHLAIKMLFHPRRPWKLRGWRVPFTPGLIPKRSEEIAGSLGRVVSEYLVTSQGFSELLRKESFQLSIVNKLSGGLRRLAETERTIGEYVLRFWPEERQEELIRAFAGMMDDVSRRGLAWLWTDRGASRMLLGDLLTNWPEERKEALLRRGAAYIAEAAREELFSPNGERLLLKMTSQLMEQAGGFLGAMASIFMDERKVALKVRQAFSDALDGAAVRQALGQMIRGQLEKAERLTLGELAALVTGGPADGEELAGWISGMFRWEEWVRRGTELRVDELLSGRVEWLEENIPRFVAFAMQFAEKNVDRVLSAIRLEEMVEAEVRGFPIERLEQIILSVSGREFRAITWLGALLGGIIGLMQAIFLQWMS